MGGRAGAWGCGQRQGGMNGCEWEARSRGGTAGRQTLKFLGPNRQGIQRLLHAVWTKIKPERTSIVMLQVGRGQCLGCCLPFQSPLILMKSKVFIILTFGNIPTFGNVPTLFLKALLTFDLTLHGLRLAFLNHLLSGVFLPHIPYSHFWLVTSYSLGQQPPQLPTPPQHHTAYLQPSAATPHPT